jgi:hypothetical protein
VAARATPLLHTGSDRATGMSQAQGDKAWSWPNRVAFGGQQLLQRSQSCVDGPCSSTCMQQPWGQAAPHCHNQRHACALPSTTSTSQHTCRHWRRTRGVTPAIVALLAVGQDQAQLAKLDGGATKPVGTGSSSRVCWHLHRHCSQRPPKFTPAVTLSGGAVSPDAASQPVPCINTTRH